LTLIHLRNLIQIKLDDNKKQSFIILDILIHQYRTMSIFTPELKDSILTFLCENCHLEQISQIDEQNIKSIQKQFKIDFHDLNAILSYFQRSGFIAELNCRQVSIFFLLRMEASDFVRTGGFTTREKIILKNAEQLLLEIELLKKQLKPDLLDNVNKISSITGVIINAVTTFTGSK